MENVQSLFLNPKTGFVDVWYHGKNRPKAQFGIVDLLWRFVGLDGRSLGVQYSGAYRSGRGMKRDLKVDALYRAREALRVSSPPCKLVSPYSIEG